MAMGFRLVYRDNDKPSHYIPLVSFDTWKTLWLPICEDKQLDWIWEIGTVGLELLEHVTELEEIADEFHILKNEIQNRTPPSVSDDNIQLKQIDAAIKQINALIANSELVASAYIG